eukprot:32026-Eustigmatos_ZCMA.PRE.1
MVEPSNTCVTDEALAEFLRSPVAEDVQSVPGITPAAMQVYKNAGVGTTYQLLAKFISFRDVGATETEVCEKFGSWLRDIGVNAFRSTV